MKGSLSSWVLVGLATEYVVNDAYERSGISHVLFIGMVGTV
jgi:hypothetical protein